MPDIVVQSLCHGGRQSAGVVVKLHVADPPAASFGIKGHYVQHVFDIGVQSAVPVHILSNQIQNHLFFDGSLRQRLSLISFSNQCLLTFDESQSGRPFLQHLI